MLKIGNPCREIRSRSRSRSRLVLVSWFSCLVWSFLALNFLSRSYSGGSSRRYTVYSMRYVCGMWYMVCGMWCMICGMVCMRYAVCGMNFLDFWTFGPFGRRSGGSISLSVLLLSSDYRVVRYGPGDLIGWSFESWVLSPGYWEGEDEGELGKEGWRGFCCLKKKSLRLYLGSR